MARRRLSRKQRACPLKGQTYLVKMIGLIVLILVLNSYRNILSGVEHGDAAKTEIIPESVSNNALHDRKPFPRAPLVRPHLVERSRRKRQGTKAKQNVPNDNNFHSSALVTDCGCPESCTGPALDRKVNGNDYTCRERIQFLMGDGGTNMDQQTACLFASKQTDPACTSACNPNRCETEQRYTGTNVLIIASAPYDEKHAVALWTELECLAIDMDLIIISVPESEWNRNFIQQIVKRAKSVLNLDNVHIHYHPNNNRHDVGLWCGALDEKVNLTENGTIVLLNDSVYALRQFTGLLDLMRSNKTVDLVGLSYSNTGGQYWIESVLRGFSSRGIATFHNHSCDSSRNTFCRQKPGVERKRCIVEHHEIGLAGLYPRNATVGLYPSDPPSNFSDTKTWVQNPLYWRDILVRQFDFPLAKVNQPEMVPDTSSELLRRCTKHMDATFIHSLDYSQFEQQKVTGGASQTKNAHPKDTSAARLTLRQPR